tara:strand:- start:36 stop:437 length:402 start_codon:yes stop_codon:yes gene_type:complete
MSEMNVISVVKYKVKDGFENEFVEALNGYDYSKSVVAKAISIGDNEYVSISEYDSIDAIGDDEVTGLEWLDNVTHMLEYFGESRTQSFWFSHHGYKQKKHICFMKLKLRFGLSHQSKQTNTPYHVCFRVITGR